MGFSSLVSGIISSPNCTKPRNHTIDSVAIHSMSSNMSAQSCGSWFSNSSCKASSNYGIDSEGLIYGYVDEDDRSWCTSNSGVDNRAITIEVANITSKEPYQISDKAYQSLINLLVDICSRHNIYLRWANDSSYAISAANGGSVEKQNMFVHKWFANKSCPGQYLMSLHTKIAEEVNSKLSINIQTNVITKNIVFICDDVSYRIKHMNKQGFIKWIYSTTNSISWLNSNKSNIDSMVPDNSIVCISIGNKDITSNNIESYVDTLNDLSENWTTRNISTYVTSIYPEYSDVGNTDKIDLNQKLRDNLNSNITYIDVYSQLLPIITIKDQPEYSESTISNLYYFILSILKQSEPTLYQNSAIIGGSPVQIDYTKLNPYIILVDRYTEDNFDYTTLISNGIVGVILEVGYLYDSIHQPVSNILQPKFNKQLKAISNCNLPFGFCFICKSMNLEEAKSEMYELSFVLRLHSPSLGVWIKFEFADNNIYNNDNIVKYYQNQLIRLGFKSKIGVYADKDMLSKFSWDIFNKDWLLWLIDPIDDLSQIQKLLDPSFFDLEVNI